MNGVGCQIRRQAGHGAAPSLAAFPEAAELIPRLAAAGVQLFFEKETATLVVTHKIGLQTMAYGN